MRSWPERIVPSDPGVERDRPTLTEVRRAIEREVELLRDVDRRLGSIRVSVEPTTVATAELLGVIEVVKRDLLADAIETLALVAGHGE